MAGPSELGQILEKLGRVSEGLDRFRDEFRIEQEHAHDSRTSVHGRLDGVGDRLSQVESAIAVDGQITAQVRVQVAELKTAMDDNIATIDEFKRMKAVGIGIVGLVALGGTAFGASLIWWGDNTVALIRHLLRIN